MATYYVDSVSGSDANNGLSPAAPKATYQNLSYAGGDTILFRRGTRQNIITEFKGVVGGSASVGHTRFGVYGTGATPYVVFEKRQPFASGIVLNLSATPWVMFEDVYWDITGNIYGPLVQGQSGTTASNIIFRRNYFTNSLFSGLSLMTDTSGVRASNILVEECKAWNNAAHGIFTLAGENITIRNCETWANGATHVDGGHGISAYPRFNTVTSGWSSGGGTVYFRSLASINAAATDIFYVRQTSGTPVYLRIDKEATPTTTPAVGKFSVTGGNLYLNINANPAGVSILCAWATARNLIITGNYCHDNIVNPSTPFTEGHGIALDDFTESSMVTNNRCVNNEGYGISINRGNNNTLTGNYIANNGGPAISVAPCVSLSVYNNTCVRNNANASFAGTGEIRLASCDQTKVSNNALMPRAGITYGIQADSGTTNLSGNTNRVETGFTAEERGTFTGNAVGSTEQYVASDGSLKIPSTATLASLPADNPLALSGTYVSGVTLANGRLRPGFTPIGAYMAVLPRTARA